MGAHVQDTPLVAISNTAQTLTFPAATTVGNVVCFMVSINATLSGPGDANLPVPSGAGVATWTLVPFPTTGSGSVIAFYYGAVTTPGSATITVTQPGGNGMGCAASEFSGVTATLIDHAVYPTFSFSSPIPVGPLHPTAAGQVAFIGNGNPGGNAGSPFTAGAPWTKGTAIDHLGGPGGNGNADWLVTTSTAALSPTYNYPGGTGFSATGGIILAASGPTVVTGTAALALGPLTTTATGHPLGAGTGTATIGLGPLTLAVATPVGGIIVVRPAPPAVTVTGPARAQLTVRRP